MKKITNSLLIFLKLIKFIRHIFHPKKINILRLWNVKNNGIVDEIKKLSEKSRLLLEKSPAYQNNINKITLVVGFTGTIIEKIPFDFQLTTEQINQYSWSYKFYDIEEKKVRDCKIYLPHDHLQNDGFILKSNTFSGSSTYHVSLDEKMENSDQVGIQPL